MVYFVLVAAGIVSGAFCFALVYRSEITEDAEKPLNRKHLLIYSIIAAVINVAVACIAKTVFHESIFEILRILALLAVLWACAWTDKKSFLIPNIVLLLGLLVCILFFAVECFIAPDSLRYNIFSALAAATAVLIISLLCRLISPNAIGFGDVKLMMLMGLYLRFGRMWSAMLFSVIVAFVYSIFLVVVKKANRKTEMPFAPILLAGTMLSLILSTV